MSTNSAFVARSRPNISPYLPISSRQIKGPFRRFGFGPRPAVEFLYGITFAKLKFFPPPHLPLVACGWSALACPGFCELYAKQLHHSSSPSEEKKQMRPLAIISLPLTAANFDKPDVSNYPSKMKLYPGGLYIYIYVGFFCVARRVFSASSCGTGAVLVNRGCKI